MIDTLALLLGLNAAPAAPKAPPAVPIAIELSQAGVYQPGDSVSVRVRTGSDGYLLVLRADAQGRVRVLFPLDPTDDAFVRGGRGYDLLSRGDRPFTFIADLSGGEGTILAALSPDPLVPGQFSLNGHWDYHVLARGSEDDDEFALRALAEQMIRTRFEYDVLPYMVEGGDAGLMADGSQSGGGSTTLAIGVGACWSCFGAWWGPGWGWGVGVGWGWGWGWSPVWAWGPAWGWGPGWGWGGPWGGGGWGGNPGWNPGTPGGPGGPGGGDRFPGLGPGEPTPYRPRVASGEGRTGDGIGVRGSLGSNAGTGYRTREGGSTIGVRGSLASSTTGYRGRGVATEGNRGVRSSGATMSGRGAGTYAGRGVRNASPGGRVTMSGRGAGTYAGRGVRSAAPGGRGATGGRGALAPSGGGRVSTGGARAGGYSGSRGYSGGSRGFSGGSRGFSGGGARGFSGGGYRGR